MGISLGEDNLIFSECPLYRFLSTQHRGHQTIYCAVPFIDVKLDWGKEERVEGAAVT